MSLTEVDNAIRDLPFKDDHIQTPGYCRYAVEKMMEEATEADKTIPFVKKEILVWPKASDCATTHYALKVSDSHGGSLAYNPNRAAGFPIYYGPLETAPGLISMMTVAQKIL